MEDVGEKKHTSFLSKKVDRRKFNNNALKGTAAVVATGGIGGFLATKADGSEGNEAIEGSVNFQEPIQHIKASLVDSAENVSIQEELKPTEINPEDYFTFDPEKLGQLSHFSGPELLPIFPPSVLQWKDLIYTLSDEFSVPPNVMATLMTIESYGKKNAESHAGAQGLFQVMPFHFEDEGISHDPASMQEVYLNGRKGMTFFNICISESREVHKDLDPNDARVFAGAMIGYNAGTDDIARSVTNYDDIPDETKFYADHFIRFAMSAQIAGQLRAQGLSNEQIVEGLESTEVNARAWALENRRQSGSFQEYSEVCKELGKAEIKDETILNDVIYFRANRKDNYPAAPGLRIWSAVAYSAPDMNMEINQSRTNWYIMPTNR